MVKFKLQEMEAGNFLASILLYAYMICVFTISVALSKMLFMLPTQTICSTSFNVSVTPCALASW